LRDANDMLALYVYTPLTLADALVAAGKPEEARQYYEAAAELAPSAGFADYITVAGASATRDIKSLSNPKLPMSAKLRTALLKGYRAAGTTDAGAKAEAVRDLLALPKEDQNDVVARLLADLGADREAFDIAARMAADEYPGPSVFWYPSMRRALADPRFPTVAARLGLMRYWKTSHARPDVCNEAAAPPFCRMI